jgi:hypothetical protein
MDTGEHINCRLSNLLPNALRLSTKKEEMAAMEVYVIVDRNEMK